MASWLTVTGVKPYDGRYRFALDEELTTREWGWIKRLSGYMPLTLEAGFEGADPELFAVLAVISMRRADAIQAADVEPLYERLLDAPFGQALTIEVDEEEADDDSPPPESSDGNTSFSGDGSTTSSETSPAPPNGSGTPGSDTSAWQPLTLES